MYIKGSIMNEIDKRDKRDDIMNEMDDRKKYHERNGWRGSIIDEIKASEAKLSEIEATGAKWAKLSEIEASGAKLD